MWRRLTLAVVAVLSITLGAFSVYAQSNAGSGNQGATTNRPRIEIIKRDITTFKETQVTEINANATQLNILADDILTEVLRVKALLDSYASPPETDPYVVGVMREGGSSQCEVVSCADDQKLHWDGSSWRCLSAVLPTCGAGTVFSTVTCSCVNPCTNPGEVPDNNGVCCQPGQIQAGECRLCPTYSTWDGFSCRCTGTNAIVNPGGICCPANSTPNFNNTMCVCTVSGNTVPGLPDGTCGSTCPTPGEDPDSQGVCCNPTTMVNGLCPVSSCPIAGHQPDNNGTCCQPASMVNGVCPVACPAGTTPQGAQCLCDSGQLINPGENCTVCPSGQLPDNNSQCCAIENLEFGRAGDACVGGGRYCAATSFANCSLPLHVMQQPNTSVAVEGSCTAGMVPAGGAPSCYATCVDSLNSTDYNAPNVGCEASTVTCPPSTRLMNGSFACPFQFGGCPEGVTTGSINCDCSRINAHNEFSLSGSFTCTAAGVWEGTGGWFCNGDPIAPEQNCGEICTQGYEMVNGECVAVCGANQVRNSSGQCVCVPNYEMVSGQCLPVCESNKVRNGAGVCECPSNLPHWYGDRCYPCPEPQIGSTHNCVRCMPANGTAFCDLNNPAGTQALCECYTAPWNPNGSGTCAGDIESEGAIIYSCINGSWQR